MIDYRYLNFTNSWQQIRASAVILLVDRFSCMISRGLLNDLIAMIIVFILRLGG